MEKNKIRTYLFYAIGEILLVVIGILLALQVNNWNEERKQTNLSEEYISRIAQMGEFHLEAAVRSFINGNYKVTQISGSENQGYHYTAKAGNLSIYSQSGQTNFSILLIK